MPFLSDSQRKACYAKNDPAWDCKEWSKSTGKKKLPKKVTANRKLSLNAKRILKGKGKSLQTRILKKRLSQPTSKAPNPLKIDPTRTLSLRRSFTAHIERRFNLLKGKIVALILKENALGLTTNTPSSHTQSSLPGTPRTSVSTSQDLLLTNPYTLDWEGRMKLCGLQVNSNPEGCNQHTGPGCGSGSAKPISNPKIAVLLPNLSLASQKAIKTNLKQVKIYKSEEDLSRQVSEKYGGQPEYRDACYTRGDGILHITASTTQETLAHELGHVVDGPSESLSSDDTFLRAWRAENKNLSAYSRVDRTEGLAELFKMRHEKGQREVETLAPRMCRALGRYWRDPIANTSTLPIPFTPQTSEYDCGAACVQSVLRYYGKGMNGIEEVSQALGSNYQDGSTVDDMVRVLGSVGLNTREVRGIQSLSQELGRGIPVITPIKDSKGIGHYVVVTSLTPKTVTYIDPQKGTQVDPIDRWRRNWHDEGRNGERYVQYGLAVYPTTNTINTRWAASSSPEQLKKFQDWLKTQIKSTLIGKDEEALWKAYIQQGWKKGVGRAFDDTKGVQRTQAYGNQQKMDFYQGSRDQFLQSSFNQPVAKEKVELMASRTFDEMEDVTDEMANKMGRILTDGLVKGDSPNVVAKSLADQCDMSLKRAKVVAQHELSRIHSEGQLTALEQLGVEDVGVMVEWSTSGLGTTASGNPSPCERCAAMQGVVMKIGEARGMLPLHVGCLCAWVPANTGEDQEDQKRSKEDIDDAFDEAGIDDEDQPDIDEDRPESILGDREDDELDGDEEEPEEDLEDTTENAFCPTGEGGGVDPTCSPHGIAKTQTLTMVHGALEANTSLSQEEKTQFKEAVSTVIDRMPEKVTQAIARRVKKYEFHSTAKGVTESAMKVDTGPLLRAAVARGAVIQGLCRPKEGHVTLDGVTKSAFGVHDISGTYAHELTHILDGPTNAYSGSKGWKEASDKELSGGKLSKYATTSHIESFAEFGRLVYGGRYSEGRIAKMFPECHRFFKKQGLI